MRSIRWSVLVAAVGAMALAVGLPASAAPTAKPSVTVVKQLLTKRNVDNKYRDKRETLTWKRIQFGKPRPGTYWADGVPPNSKTIVYPVRARFLKTIRQTRDNWKTVFWRTVWVYEGEYVFFKNEFGSWTYRSGRVDSKLTVNVYNP